MDCCIAYIEKPAQFFLRHYKILLPLIFVGFVALLLASVYLDTPTTRTQLYIVLGGSAVFTLLVTFTAVNLVTYAILVGTGRVLMPDNDQNGAQAWNFTPSAASAAV
jgi:hypothetical protein